MYRILSTQESKLSVHSISHLEWNRDITYWYTTHNINKYLDWVVPFPDQIQYILFSVLKAIHTGVGLGMRLMDYLTGYPGMGMRPTYTQLASFPGHSHILPCSRGKKLGNVGVAWK